MVYVYWELRHENCNSYSMTVRVRVGEIVKRKVEEVHCHGLFYYYLIGDRLKKAKGSNDSR